MICLRWTLTLISDAVNACKPGIAKQSAQGRLLSSASRACREPVALSAFSRLPRAYAGFGNRSLRLIGVGAGVGQKGIAITSAATTGGHCLTLLQSLKAEGEHARGD